MHKYMGYKPTIMNVNEQTQANTVRVFRDTMKGVLRAPESISLYTARHYHYNNNTTEMHVMVH